MRSLTAWGFLDKGRKVMKKRTGYFLSFFAVLIAVVLLMPLKNVSAKTRLSCNSEGEIWFNRTIELQVTLDEKQKDEDITVKSNKPAYVKVKKEGWEGNVCTISLTPKKEGNATLTVRNGSETLKIKLHMSLREKLDATGVYAKIESAMVSIHSKDSLGNVYVGSGFFVARDKILTCYHVIDSASEITVTDYHGNKYPVKEILGYSTEKDLLLMKVKTPKKATNSALIPTGVLSKTGDTVYACGSPYGLEATFSQGTVSMSDRILEGNHYIQMTVPTSIGSGGAPLVNEYCELVGIVCRTYSSGQNLNFAIPITDLSEAEKDADWKPIPTSDFYKFTYGRKKTGNEYGLSENVVQKTSADLNPGPSGVNSPSYNKQKEKSPSEIFGDSVCSIVSVLAYDSSGKGSLGSGFFIDENRLITNYHVIEKSHRAGETNLEYSLIYAIDYKDRMYRVKDVKYDSNHDIAVITVQDKPVGYGDDDDMVLYLDEGSSTTDDKKDTDKEPAESDLPDTGKTENGNENNAAVSDEAGSKTLKNSLFDAENIQKADDGIKDAENFHGWLEVDYDYIPYVGENVYALGNPEGLNMTFSSGIVSTSIRTIDGTDTIQITAPITKGSSGGALLNKYGHVIGVTAFAVTGDGKLNWSIMVRYAQKLL